MDRKAQAWCVLALSFACSPERSLKFPEVEGQSALVAIDNKDVAAVFAMSLSLGAEVPPFAFDQGHETLLFSAYLKSLDDLGLSTGPVQAVTAEEGGIHLPPPDIRLRAEFRDNAISWLETPELARSLAEFRYAPKPREPRCREWRQRTLALPSIGEITSATALDSRTLLLTSLNCTLLLVDTVTGVIGQTREASCPAPVTHTAAAGGGAAYLGRSNGELLEFKEGNIPTLLRNFGVPIEAIAAPATQVSAFFVVAGNGLFECFAPELFNLVPAPVVSPSQSRLAIFREYEALLVQGDACIVRKSYFGVHLDLCPDGERDGAVQLTSVAVSPAGAFVGGALRSGEQLLLRGELDGPEPWNEVLRLPSSSPEILDLRPHPDGVVLVGRDSIATFHANVGLCDLQRVEFDPATRVLANSADGTQLFLLAPDARNLVIMEQGE